MYCFFLTSQAFLLIIDPSQHSELLEDLHSQTQRYNDLLDVTDISLKWSAARGYYLNVPAALSATPQRLAATPSGGRDGSGGSGRGGSSGGGGSGESSGSGRDGGGVTANSRSPMSESSFASSSKLSWTPSSSTRGNQPLFQQQVRRGKRILCSTSEIISLNDRQREAFNEIISITAQLTTRLLTAIRHEMTWLYLLAESLAFLDLTVSFATFTLLGQAHGTYTRPLFTADGPLLIRGGRHPVIERNIAAVIAANAAGVGGNGAAPRTFTANDCVLSPEKTMAIVTGPNSSGKSTYLRMVRTGTCISCISPSNFVTFVQSIAISPSLINYTQTKQNKHESGRCNDAPGAVRMLRSGDGSNCAAM